MITIEAGPGSFSPESGTGRRLAEGEFCASVDTLTPKDLSLSCTGLQPDIHISPPDTPAGYLTHPQARCAHIEGEKISFMPSNHVLGDSQCGHTRCGLWQPTFNFLDLCNMATDGEHAPATQVNAHTGETLVSQTGSRVAEGEVCNVGDTPALMALSPFHPEPSPDTHIGSPDTPAGILTHSLTRDASYDGDIAS